MRASQLSMPQINVRAKVGELRARLQDKEDVDASCKDLLDFATQALKDPAGGKMLIYVHGEDESSSEEEEEEVPSPRRSQKRVLAAASEFAFDVDILMQGIREARAKLHKRLRRERRFSANEKRL